MTEAVVEEVENEAGVEKGEEKKGEAAGQSSSSFDIDSWMSENATEDNRSGLPTDSMFSSLDSTVPLPIPFAHPLPETPNDSYM